MTRDVADHPPGGQHVIAEIRTTFSRRDDAEACAVRLVERRLAACVQIDGPVISVYRWEGVVESTEEFRCTCKTSIERADACADAILAMHGYETPQLIITTAAASPGYATWVHDGVRPTN